MRRLLLVLLPGILLCPPSGVHAQTAGQIVGLVETEAGVALPGALVELVQAARVLASTQSDSTGAFRFAQLQPGRYTVTARIVGYSAGEQRSIELAAGRSVLVRLRLAPAPIQLTGVEAVSTAAVSISKVETEFGSKLEAAAIRALPIGHEARDLVALTPGARASHVWGGATAQANNYQFDGVAANHPGIGGDLIQPSISWIEAVEVLGLGAGAEHGNFQGGLINIITKTGTNEFQGSLRMSGESHRLNATSLVASEAGSEVAARYDVEGEVRGAIVRDRLFYFIAAQWLQRDLRYMNHLPLDDEVRYSPVLEQRAEGKFFGKLTYRPGADHSLDLTATRFEQRTDHYGLSGYEEADATLRLRAPTSSYAAAWTSRFAGGMALEARLAHFTRDEQRDPYAGPNVPGIMTWGFTPPFLGYQNAPLRYRHSPSSTGGSLDWVLNHRTGQREHQLRIGVEHNVGRFRDQRLRNGGLTWRPARLRSLDPLDASTWFISATPFTALVTGGEVDLHAEVENSAVYVQSAIALLPRVSISPGLRYGRWAGRLIPGGDAAKKFTAVETSAPEPRIGLIIDAFGDNTFAVKAHWGRYHQNMIAQMFERAAGGSVFSNEETWYYYGPIFSNPATTFGAAERAAMAADGTLLLQNVIRLNEEGPIENYRQPYIDQWVVGLEKTFANVVKAQLVYVNRRNRDMVALVDRNRASNYTVYDRVRVFGLDGQALPLDGGTVQLFQLHLPNDVLRERLRCRASGLCPDSPMPPGLSLGDTARLTWNPDYVLTTAPGAKRRTDQLQFMIDVVQPKWSLSASVVFSNLEGNLDNVTGYDDPSGFGAGPYVRVNEGVNSYGKLPNFADRELKLTYFGELPWRLRGGIYWTRTSGDHFTPYFTIPGAGTYTYRLFSGNQLVDNAFFARLAGHRVLIGPRGRQQHLRRARLDFRLERTIPVGSRDFALALDVFNVINSAVVTDVNKSVNRGQNFYGSFGPQYDGFRVIDPSEYYLAVRQREEPRGIRLGTAFYF